MQYSHSAPAYGFSMLQRIRYIRACQYFTDLFNHAIHYFLTLKLLEQGYVASRLKSSLQKFYGGHHELVNHYGVFICTMKADFFQHVIVFLSSFVFPGVDFLWATRRVFLEKRRTLIISMHLLHALSFLWSPSCSFTSLLRMYYFGYFMFVVVCLFFMPGFVPKLHSFDFC